MKGTFMKWMLVAAFFFVACQGANVQGGLGGKGSKGAYTYHVDARTLTALGVKDGGDESTGRWAGVHLSGRLTLETKEQGQRYLGQLSQVSYGHIHHVLPGGWNDALPKDVQYQSYPAIERPFEVKVENGLVKELIVSKDTGVQEENLLKGVLSTLQYDISSHNLQKTKESFLDEKKENGVYRKMETDVTGKCGTLYSVKPLPYDILQQDPKRAPFVQLDKLEKGERQQLLEITKTKDHGDCESRVAYHFGVPKDANWEKTSRTSNNFMSRSTSYKIIADRFNHTIYSASSIGKVLASPMLYNGDKGMVVSFVNMTLLAVDSSSNGLKSISGGRSAGSLMYRISSNSHHQSNRGENSRGSSEENNRNSNNNRQTDQHNSRHQQQQQESKKRFRRSALPNYDETEYKNQDYDDGQSHKDQNRRLRINAENNSGRQEDQDQSRKQEHHGYSSEEQMHQRQRQHNYGGRSSSRSSGSSESSDKWEDVPDKNAVPIESMYVNREEQKQQKTTLVENLRKLLSEIVKELQTPNQMPEADTVGKLNILVRIVSQMDSQLLTQSTKIMFDKRDAARTVTWKLYRDAVAQSGTTPAYLQIKKWIESRKIQGEEAAQVISILPRTLRNPTKEMTEDFFRFSLSKDVHEQQFLNSTALLASTNLIKEVHVDNRTAHNRLPSHLFGRESPKTEEIVTKVVLPTLEEKLRSAIERQDSHKTQVYIEAIGNVAHPKILEVFSPYLEGKQRVSTYLRTHMVKNLNKLAKMYPEHTRNTLFNIYKNEGEDYEVRVAAIYRLLNARPTTSMFYQMAEDTHVDSSIHVRSAIQSAITYASRLQLPKHKDLARKARAALVMMSRKQYGNQYSSAYLDDYMDEEMNIGYEQAYFQIGSLDSMLPKSIAYMWKTKLGGWMKPTKIQSSISSVGQLREMLKQLLREDEQRQGHGQSQSGSGNQRFDAESIAKILNIKGDAQKQLEGNLFVKAFNQERFFAIGEQGFKHIPQMAQKAYKELQNGLNFNYTKFVSEEDTVMMFPLVMGVPSFITYSTPTLIRIDGKAHIKSQGESTNYGSLSVPKAVNVTGEIEILYARNIQGKMGFINTVGKQVEYITSGVVMKSQVHIPLKVRMDIDLQNSNMVIETSLMNEQGETDIIAHSVSPFSSIAAKNSYKPVLQQQGTKLQRKQQPQMQHKESYGRETGTEFQVEATYDQVEDNSRWSKKVSEKLMSVIAYGKLRKNFAYSKLVVKHDARKSSTSKMIVTLGYENNKRYRQGKNWAYTAKMNNNFPSEITVGSQRRQQEMLQKVTEGIHNARSSVLDIGVEFLGQKKAQYALTAAIASSPVDEKLEGIFFFNRHSADGKQYQIYSEVTAKMPRAPIENYEHAAKFDARAELKANIKFGEKVNSGSQINIEAKMEKSQESKEHLRQSPVTKQCEREMKNGNNLMEACRGAAVKANIMDHLKLQMTYEKVGEQEKNITYQGYSMVRRAFDKYISENWQTQGKADKIELEMKLYPEMDALNITIQAPNVNIMFRNVPVGKYARNIVSLHPTLTPKDFLIRSAFNYQGMPTCVIDGNKVTTYSNITFPYTVSKSWHVVMVNGSKQVPSQHGSYIENSNQQVTVLVRKDGDKKEVQINYTIKPRMQVNVHLSNGKIVLNGKQLDISNKKIYQLWEQKDDSLVLTAYNTNTGESVVEFDNNNLRVVANNHQVLLLAGETFRNNTRGLCGRMSGERKYDLATPNNCYLRNDQQFAATWALAEQNDEHVKSLQHQAQQSPCIHRQKQYPTIQSSHGNYQWPEQSSDVSHEYKGRESWEENQPSTRGFKSQKGCELQRQMQIVEKHGKICISQMPLPACGYGCQPRGVKSLPSNVICRPENDEEFRRMKEQIQQGQNPQELSQHKANQQIVFRAPTSCQQ